MVSFLWLLSRRRTLPVNLRRSVNLVTLIAYIQASLGIGTLIYFVPLEMAASHQAGSLLLLTSSLHLMHLLKRCPK